MTSVSPSPSTGQHEVVLHRGIGGVRVAAFVLRVLPVLGGRDGGDRESQGALVNVRNKDYSRTCVSARRVAMWKRVHRTVSKAHGKRTEHIQL